MAASWPNSIVAPTSSESIFLHMESESAPPPKLADLVYFLCLELIHPRVTWKKLDQKSASEKLYWRRYIQSSVWIHGSQPATWCCGPYILRINLLANGIRISSSSQTCRCCWFLELGIDWFQSYINKLAL